MPVRDIAADIPEFDAKIDGVPDTVIEKARLGDNFALETVFERFKGLVRAKSRSYFLFGADGEDLIQEGMIGLYKAIRDYRPDGRASFRVFADICITRNIMTAVSAAARKKHFPLNNYVSLSKPLSDDDGDGELIDTLYETSTIDPAEELVAREQSLSFEDELKKELTTLENSVLSLYLEGAPYSEISRTLKKPEKSIDNALQRVKRKLAKHLDGPRKS